MKDDTKGLAEILKEQLALLALVLLLAGTVYADAYYAQFGIKLSSLGFSSSYLIYRAFSALTYAPLISLPYLLSLLWFGIDELVIRRRESFKVFRIIAAYIVLVLVIVFSYLCAYTAGLNRARDDMHAEKSSLSRIQSAHPSIGDCGPGDCRILTSDSENLYVIKPTPLSSGAIPNVRILEKKNYDELIVGSH